MCFFLHFFYNIFLNGRSYKSVCAIDTIERTVTHPIIFYRNRDKQSGKQQVKQQRWILTGLSQCLKWNQKDEAEECCYSEVWINILHVVVRLCLRQSRLICLSSMSTCLRLWLHWTFTRHKTRYMYSCLL